MKIPKIGESYTGASTSSFFRLEDPTTNQMSESYGPFAGLQIHTAPGGWPILSSQESNIPQAEFYNGKWYLLSDTEKGYSHVAMWGSD